MKVIILIFLFSLGISQNIVTSITSTYEDGTPSEIKYYKKNKNQIEIYQIERYYTTGTMKSLESYKSGNKHGRCKYFTPSGDLYRELTYNNGEVTYEKKYSSTSSPIEGFWIDEEGWGLLITSDGFIAEIEDSIPATMEKFDDINGNHMFDPGEPFNDENNNGEKDKTGNSGKWDFIPGRPNKLEIYDEDTPKAPAPFIFEIVFISRNSIQVKALSGMNREDVKILSRK